MANHTFILNGKRVNVDVEDDVRLLWVLRDILGVTGPKYGCGIGVCQACTSHINGKAVNICSVPISQIKPNDRVTTIEGLPATVGKPLHPMQKAWIKHDVSQCGYCQPGQIMAAVALVKRKQRTGRKITDKDLDHLRNVCRCGTYPRIREAIREGERGMRAQKRKPIKAKKADAA
jgi:isoquinoline 1-oxidoreductase alpha subunit